MRVLLLGGAGRFGLFTARRLIASDIVSEVAIAGRNQDALTPATSELGEKARVVQVDIHDERRLASVAADYDIIVNVAGPEWEVLLSALRTAIASRPAYLSYVFWPESLLRSVRSPTGRSEPCASANVARVSVQSW